MTVSSVRLRATVFLHQGAVRTNNEDTVAVGDWLCSRPMAAPERLERLVEAPLLCLVADGMGGHAAGEVASRAVAEHLQARAADAVDGRAVAAMLHDANAQLFDLMEERPASAGMGTTIAGIGVRPDGLTVFNVGDSRVHRIAGRRLIQLSVDDTPGPKLGDGRTAVTTSNLVTQTLGGDHQFAPIAPHIEALPIEDGSAWLISTDGLTDLVPRGAMEALLGDDDTATVQALYDAAMAAGGRDNISIVLVRIEVL
jgi:serine/threonine protein phosphatase PrpC